MNFKDLGLNQEIVDQLAKKGITKPTLIQEKAIPATLEGRHVIGISKTGSGKTLAFGAPCVQLINPRGGLQLLILAPTRELVHQITEQVKLFAGGSHLFVACIYGGVAFDPQVQNLRKAQVIVATPGRLLDHLGRGTADLSKISMFVLDEADKMVEMGFIDDVEQILQATGKQRQILLFSATMSNEIDHIKNTYMGNPHIAKAEEYVQADFLEQYYYDCEAWEKFSLLVHLLKKDDVQRGIVFCSKRVTVDQVARNLRKQKFKVEAIHGKMTQNKRLRMMELFNEGKVDILVASSVAARGLDIQGVTHVFNYDLGRDAQEYVHRVGRTARAGQQGKAFTLLSAQDHDVFRVIMSRYEMDIEQLPAEKFEKLRFERDNPRHGRSGNRNRGDDRSHGGHRGRSSGGPRRGNTDRRAGSDRRDSRSSSPRGRSGGSRSDKASQYGI